MNYYTQRRTRRARLSLATGVYYAALGIGLLPTGYTLSFLGALAVNPNLTPKPIDWQVLTYAAPIALACMILVCLSLAAIAWYCD